MRVVRTADGGLAVGRTLPGRGAWLCEGSPACVELARRRHAFERALRGPVEEAAIAALALPEAAGVPSQQPLREDGGSVPVPSGGGSGG